MQRLIISTLLLFLLSMPALGTTSSRLHHLITTIEHLKTRLGRAHHQQSHLQSQLKQAEVSIGQLNIALKHNERQQQHRSQRIKDIKNQEVIHEQLLDRQMATLQQQIRADYMLGHQATLRMLLNQQRPSHVSRISTYYQYMIQQRYGLIEKIQQTLQTLAQDRQDINTHEQALHKLHQQLQHEKRTLLQQQQHRHRVLTALQHKIHSQKQHLANLQHNKHALLALIKRLQAQRTALHTRFARQRGRLLWPTQGRLLNAFGQAIAHSQLHWQGVLISAKAGQAVRAIAPGKVIFANWLSGYGLLIIVDHGHDYITLYGRNNSLYRHKGQTVKPGDLLATVGDSGGYHHAALYFAIRHHSKALDPTVWCRRRSQRTRI